EAVAANRAAARTVEATRLARRTAARARLGIADLAVVDDAVAAPGAPGARILADLAGRAAARVRADEVKRLAVLELPSPHDLDRVPALRASERPTDRPARRRRAEAVVRGVAACESVHEAVRGGRGADGGDGEQDDDGHDRPAVSHAAPRLAGVT